MIDMEKHKKTCGSFLKANGIKPDSLKGRDLIHAYWYGVLVQADDMTNTSINIRLISGRQEDLVEM